MFKPQSRGFRMPAQDRHRCRARGRWSWSPSTPCSTPQAIGRRRAGADRPPPRLPRRRLPPPPAPAEPAGAARARIGSRAGRQRPRRSSPRPSRRRAPRTGRSRARRWTSWDRTSTIPSCGGTRPASVAASTPSARARCCSRSSTRPSSAKNYAEAMARYDQIPADSIYKRRAKPRYDEARTLLVAEHMAAADKARTAGRCAEVKTEVAEVVRLDPEEHDREGDGAALPPARRAGGAARRRGPRRRGRRARRSRARARRSPRPMRRRRAPSAAKRAEPPPRTRPMPTRS